MAKTPIIAALTVPFGACRKVTPAQRALITAKVIPIAVRTVQIFMPVSLPGAKHNREIGAARARVKPINFQTETLPAKGACLSFVADCDARNHGARAFTSAGRFSPLGPRGIESHRSLGNS